MTTETKTQDTAALLAEIAKAMRDPGLTAARAADLAETAQRAAAEASIAAADARQASLDPSLAFEHVEAARLEADRADHDARRILAAMDSLTARAEKLEQAEDADARLARYHAADTEAARVADMIQTNWPQIEAQLIDLLDAVMSANDQIDRVNRDLPEGMPKLHRPEGRARGFPDAHPLNGADGNLPLESEIIRLTSMLVPAFSATGGELAWPPGLARWQFSKTGGRRVADLLDPRVVISLWRKARRPRE